MGALEEAIEELDPRTTIMFVADVWRATLRDEVRANETYSRPGGEIWIDGTVSESQSVWSGRARAHIVGIDALLPLDRSVTGKPITGYVQWRASGQGVQDFEAGEVTIHCLVSAGTFNSLVSLVSNYRLHIAFRLLELPPHVWDGKSAILIRETSFYISNNWDGVRELMR